MLLTARQEDVIRVAIFKMWYKTLADEIPEADARFAQAIADTSDSQIDLNQHEDIVKKWLDRFYYKKCNRGTKNLKGYEDEETN